MERDGGRQAQPCRQLKGLLDQHLRSKALGLEFAALVCTLTAWCRRAPQHEVRSLPGTDMQSPGGLNVQLLHWTAITGHRRAEVFRVIGMGQQVIRKEMGTTYGLWMSICSESPTMCTMQDDPVCPTS